MMVICRDVVKSFAGKHGIVRAVAGVSLEIKKLAREVPGKQFVRKEYR